MRLLAALLTIGVLFGQTIVDGPLVSSFNTMEGQVKFGWTTSTNTTNTSARCSLSADYSSSSTPSNIEHTVGGAPFMHSARYSSLRAGTQYFCIITIGGVDQVGTGEFTFTTALDTDGEADVAILPQTQVTVAYPTGTFNTPITLNANCDNWWTPTTGVRAQLIALTGSNHQEVIVDVDPDNPVICEEWFDSWPVRPNHTGKVVVKSGATLPPFGTLFDPNVMPSSHLAKFRPNLFPLKEGPVSLDTYYNVYAPSATPEQCAAPGGGLIYSGGGGAYISATDTMPGGALPVLYCHDPEPTGSRNITAFSNGTNASSDPLKITLEADHGITVGMTGVFNTAANTFVQSSRMDDIVVVSAVVGNVITIHSTATTASPTYTGTGAVFRPTPWKLVTSTVTTSDAPTTPCDENAANGGRFWWNTTATDGNPNGKYWWCVDEEGTADGQGVYQRIYLPTVNTQGNLWRFASQAQDYIFYGIELMNGNVPNPINPMWDVEWTSIQRVDAFNWHDFVNMGSGSTGPHSTRNIHFVTSWIHGALKDDGQVDINVKSGSYLRGVNTQGFAAAGMYLSGMEAYRPESGGTVAYTQTTEGPEGINMFGNGPGLITDTYMEYHNLGFFCPENGDNGICYDWTIQRSVFHMPEYLIYGRPANLALRPGKRYNIRQGAESKSSYRTLLDGVTFQNHGANANQGATVIISPRCHRGLPDVTVSSNAFFSFQGGRIISWTNGVFTINADMISATDNIIPAREIGTGSLVVIRGTGSIDGMYEVTQGSQNAAGGPGLATTFTIGALSASSGTGGAGQNVYMVLSHKGTMDYTVRNSLFYNNVEILNTTSTDGNCVTGDFSFTRRITMDNNLVVNIDAGDIPGGFVDPAGISILGGKLHTSQGRANHERLTNFTVYGMFGNGPRYQSNDNSSGRYFSANHLICNTNAMNPFIEGFTGGTQGTAGLNNNFNHGGSSFPAWNVTDWALCRAAGAIANYPPTFKWPTAEADVKFVNPSVGSIADLDRFKLRYDSPYGPGGAERRSRAQGWGANIDEIKRATGRIKGQMYDSVTTNSARVCFYDHDTVAREIEYGTSSQYLTGDRETTDSGRRRKCASLSGLTPDTVYYARIYSSYYHPYVVFRTKAE